MATFRDIHSGQTVSFTNAYDIDQMRKQTLDYVEVDNVEGSPPDEKLEKVKVVKAKQRAYNGHPDSVAA